MGFETIPEAMIRNSLVEGRDKGEGDCLMWKSGKCRTAVCGQCQAAANDANALFDLVRVGATERVGMTINQYGKAVVTSGNTDYYLGYFNRRWWTWRVAQQL